MGRQNKRDKKKKKKIKKIKKRPQKPREKGRKQGLKRKDKNAIAEVPSTYSQSMQARKVDPWLKELQRV